MKKSIVAMLVSAALVLSALLAACGQPMASATRAVPPPKPDYRTQEEKVLDAVWLQTTLAIELGTSASPSQRAAMYTGLQQIEDVQRTLVGISEARGTLLAVMLNQGASASQIDETLGAIESGRQAVLARVGLAH